MTTLTEAIDKKDAHAFREIYRKRLDEKFNELLPVLLTEETQTEEETKQGE